MKETAHSWFKSINSNYGGEPDTQSLMGEV